MADSFTATYRPIFIEDLGTSQSLAQTTTTIFGLGPGILVTPIATAISDSQAAGFGLSVGDVYVATGVSPIRLRAMGPFGGGGGGGGGGVTKLTGSLTINVGSVDDGTVLAVSANLSISGIFVGDAVSMATIPSLPLGILAVGKVTGAGSVAIEIWNLSGSTVTLGQVTFNAQVFH